jgi:hypothetical protein
MIGDGDCGEIGGMKIGRGNLPQCHFVHHKSHMIFKLLLATLMI